MKMKKKRIGILLAACAALVVLIVAVPILTSLNTKIADYPYSPELPKPGVGVDIRDQAIAYAEKMRAHGVDVTENLIEGAYHGFDGNMGSDLVRRTLETRVNWLKAVESGSRD